MKRSVQRALATVVMAGGLVAAVAPPASAAVIVSGLCRPDSVVNVCIEEYGPTRLDYDLVAVENGDVVASMTVAAYRDVYALGTLQFTCITPVVNGQETDVCGKSGFTRVERHVLLAQQDVKANAQRVKVIATIYVCEADLTATVLSNGLNKEPILTVCATGMPTFGT